MAILEVGLNFGSKSIIEVKYYTSDSQLDPNLRAGFLSALESFTTEVFGDNINVVSLASYKLVCYSELVELPGKESENTQNLLYYAIVEKDTDVNVVKDLLEEINLHFQNRYSRHDILEKKSKYFRKFNTRITEILGDLAMKTEDRFRSIF